MAWSIAHTRRDWELGLFSLEKSRLRGIFSMCRNTWCGGGVKRMELGSSQWCPGMGQEVMGTN